MENKVIQKIWRKIQFSMLIRILFEDVWQRLRAHTAFFHSSEVFFSKQAYSAVSHQMENILIVGEVHASIPKNSCIFKIKNSWKCCFLYFFGSILFTILCVCFQWKVTVIIHTMDVGSKFLLMTREQVTLTPALWNTIVIAPSFLWAIPTMSSIFQYLITNWSKFSL